LLFSCSTSSDLSSNKLIQKRKYNKGYHFLALNKSNHNSLIHKKNTLFESSLDYDKGIEQLNSLTASVDNNTDFNYFSKAIFNKENSFTSKPLVDKIIKRKLKKLKEKLDVKVIANCDVIIFADGHEESVKIIEITNYDVKYKRCDNIDGPTFTKSIGTIFKIKYSNGSEDVFGNEASSNANNNDSDYLGLGLDGEGKDQEIALMCLAACLIGFFGIHRMYLGYWGIGILHFLTAGFCFIGTIIDLVKILDGSLKPKNGEYKS
jgi:hypothetical protein